MRDVILESTEMEGLAPVDQAKQAIQHILMMRFESPTLAYCVGPGSRTFGLLTEAHATLWKQPVVKVRTESLEANAVDPEIGNRRIKQVLEEWDWIVKRYGSKCMSGDCERCVHCRLKAP